MHQSGAIAWWAIARHASQSASRGIAFTDIPSKKKMYLLLCTWHIKNRGRLAYCVVNPALLPHLHIRMRLFYHSDSSIMTGVPRPLITQRTARHTHTYIHSPEGKKNNRGLIKSCGLRSVAFWGKGERLKNDLLFISEAEKKGGDLFIAPRVYGNPCSFPDDNLLFWGLRALNCWEDFFTVYIHKGGGGFKRVLFQLRCIMRPSHAAVRKKVSSVLKRALLNLFL